MLVLLLNEVVAQLYFFFSSRRRHTRFDCDWSSDVCSSDLLQMRQILEASGQKVPESKPVLEINPGHPLIAKLDARSEEHTSELQSQSNLVCRLLLEKKKEPWHHFDQ